MVRHRPGPDRQPRRDRRIDVVAEQRLARIHVTGKQAIDPFLEQFLAECRGRAPCAPELVPPAATSAQPRVAQTRRRPMFRQYTTSVSATPGHIASRGTISMYCRPSRLSMVPQLGTSRR